MPVLSSVAQSDSLRPPGFDPARPRTEAITGARIVVRPGTEVSGGTIVIRDGRIVAAGAGAAVPPDARVHDASGRVVYAGFIDSYLEGRISSGGDEPSGDGRYFGTPSAEAGAGRGEPGILAPDRRMLERWRPDDGSLEKLRAAGFAVGHIVPPADGILRGSTLLAGLNGKPAGLSAIVPDAFQVAAFQRSQSPAGQDRGSRPAAVYPSSLMGGVAAVRQTFLDARHHLSWNAWSASHPDTARPQINSALDALTPALTGIQPVLFVPGSAVMTGRAAQVARELSVRAAILSSGEEWRRPDIAAGTALPFIVPVDFPELPKLPTDDDWEEISLDRLRAFDWAPENPAVLRRAGLEIALTTHGLSSPARFRANLRLAIARGLSQDDALAALTTIPARLLGAEKLLGTVEPGRLACLTVVDEPGYFDADAKVRQVWINGQPFDTGDGKAPDQPPGGQGTEKAEKPEKAEPAKPEAESGAGPSGGRREREALLAERVARSPLEGRGPLASPPAVCVTNATIWTSGPRGILENAGLLIANGRIVAVGDLPPREKWPDGVLHIDGTGLHVTPGLIDCHSHAMILGGVNEATLPSTAMVRISDVVNPDAPTIHQQLGGGLTVSNLLHGSANPIGGQNCVIKLRDGAPPEDLILEGAPPGIKFALGENVKQSNRGERFTTRFPQTRMGVPVFYENRFTAARQYLADRARFERSGGAPVRRDLELEALGEILQGRRLIHCHSYRQDEILAFLRTMESFGVRVATLQHVLEGYKVADEIAKHGAGASAFSDWWAYKLEVYDAIPFAGSLMHERGVLVSFNSDDADLARRLHLEAAKAVRYGATPEADALHFVTIHPAKQLGIDARVGSLEPGKDGDFVIWTGSPLDALSVCRETWIDGRKYFDRELAAARAAALGEERAALLAKARKLDGSRRGGKPDPAAVERFFRESLESSGSHLRVHACEDCTTLDHQH